MASDLMDPGILSDEQIEQLIQEAEARAQVRQTAITAPVAEDELRLETDLSGASRRKPIPKLKHGIERSSYIQDNHGVARVKPEFLATKEQQALADQLRKVEMKNRRKKETKRVNSGEDWFNLPRTVLTPTLKRDIQLISMRSVLDPHRHYKKSSSKSNIPHFSQTGTVIEGPTEFYSARINRKDRAKSFVEEAMATEKSSGRFKRKYAEIQDKKTSGKKAHYKALMKKRKRK